MKTLKPKTTSNSNSSKPFFDKSDVGTFSAQFNKTESPFFTPPIVQTKLTTGQPGDKYEQEADTMAKRVVQKLENPKPSPPIQTKPDNRIDEKNIQEKELTEGDVTPKRAFESDIGPSGKNIQPKSKNPKKPQLSKGLEDKLQKSKGKGEPLPEDIRTQMEAAFNVNFSDIRIHTDSEAIQMSQELGAKAFTNGRDIYFNSAKYNPQSSEGKSLLAHELTHTIQQGGGSNTSYPQQEDIIQKQTDEQVPNSTSIIPGYTQNYNECGAASLVTALIIWDEVRRRQNPHAPGDQIALACSIILDYMANERDLVIENWQGRTLRGHNEDSPEEIYSKLRSALTLIRDHSQQAGAIISESEYNVIGLTLYFLWNEQGRIGLSSTQIRGIRQLLNLETSGATSYPQNFSEIFSSTTIQGLQPGQIAQVVWYIGGNRQAREGSGGNVSLQGHAFLIGRYADGDWFLSDQGLSASGTDESVIFEATSLDNLRTDVQIAAQNNEYWIWTGSAPSTNLTAPPSEATLLNQPNAREIQSRLEALNVQQGRISGARRRFQYISGLALEGTGFRVRITALLSLSRMLNDQLIRPSDYRPILRQTLVDDHPAVRAISAERTSFHRFSE